MNETKKTHVFKKLLEIIFRIEGLYGCERLKAQSQYPDIYCWFEEYNKSVEDEVRQFLKKRLEKISLEIDTTDIETQENFDLNEDDIVFKFAQFFWDHYQYDTIDYNKALFKELKLEKEEVLKFFADMQRLLNLRGNRFTNFYEMDEFSKKYKLSAFVDQKGFIKSLFQYFKLLYFTENKNELYIDTDLSAEFLKIIKIVPYFSILSRSSIYGYHSYDTTLGKKYYSQLRLPLDTHASALADNMIHFIFQYLVEIFYFKELKNESHNFDIFKDLRRGMLFCGFDEEKVSLKSMQQESQLYENIDACIVIIEKLLETLPVKQKKIFGTTKKESEDIAPLLLSILHAHFIRKYDLESSNSEDVSLNEIYRLPLKSNAKKIKAFFQFLDDGFKEIDLDVNFIHLRNADDCEFYLIKDEVDLIHMAGSNIKDNFRKHKKFFKYE